MASVQRLRLADHSLDTIPNHRWGAVPSDCRSASRFRNRADEELLLERITVEVPHLSLYFSADEHLWTEAITVTREEISEPIEVRIREGAPRVADGAKRAAAPRTRLQGNRLLRAIEALF